MPPQPKRYYCDCKEKCYGTLRVISESTYKRHKKWRQKELGERFSQLLPDGVIAQATSSTHAPSKRRNYSTDVGQAAKRLHHESEVLSNHLFNQQ
jgi:hypothetical protein